MQLSALVLNVYFTSFVLRTMHCLRFWFIVSFGQLQRTLKGCRSEHKYLVCDEIFGNSTIINKFARL